MSARSEKAQQKLQSSIIRTCKRLAQEKLLDLAVIMGSCGAEKATTPGRAAFWVQPGPFRTAIGNDFGVFEISLEKCVHATSEELDQALYDWVSIMAIQHEDKTKVPHTDQINADTINAVLEGLAVSPTASAQRTRRSAGASADLTIRVGKDTRGKIWMSQQFGLLEDPRTYLTLSDLSIMALEFDCLSDTEAADFVRDTGERIERTPLGKPIEGLYTFPGNSGKDIQ